MSHAFYIVMTMVVIFAVLAYRLGAAVPDPVIDVSLMLEAIKQTENTPRQFIGRAGERSEWQITRTVWLTYSHRPFEWASSYRAPAIAETRNVARQHVEWIIHCLPGLELPKDPYWVALIWTAGYGAVKNDAVHPFRLKSDYAARAANTYAQLKRISTP